MATNGILDIQETTEDFRDPDMELSPEETMDIIKTLQVVGVPQEHYGDFTEEFKVWKQNNNGTFDMFLEEKYQLPSGTITKIKTEQQVAQGPDDVLTEEDTTIQPGSGDMLEIMQSVGAPQRAGLGGRIGYGSGTAYPDPNRVIPQGDLKTNLLNYFGNKFAGREQVQPLLGGQTRKGESFMANLIPQSFQNLDFKLRNEYEDYIASGGDLEYEDWKTSRGAAKGGRIGYQAGGYKFPALHSVKKESCSQQGIDLTR